MGKHRPRAQCHEHSLSSSAGLLGGWHQQQSKAHCTVFLVKITPKKTLEITFQMKSASATKPGTSELENSRFGMVLGAPLPSSLSCVSALTGCSLPLLDTIQTPSDSNFPRKGPFVLRVEAKQRP